jgi:hypothetical protein
LKKILIVGVLDVWSSTNVAMKKGFVELGCGVFEYNYRRRSEICGGPEKMWADFLLFLGGHKFDLIIFSKTDIMHPTILDKAKAQGPTWYWFMDGMNVCKAMSASTFAQNATYASATASDVYDRFASVNKNAHHIMEGYNPEVYFKKDMKKIHDAVFIGNATHKRIGDINNLRHDGLKVTIFGAGWPIGMGANAPVHGEDEAIEINQSHIVLNLCHDDTIFSDRIVKSLACGANVISQVTTDLIQFARKLPLLPETLRDLDDIDDFEWVAFSDGYHMAGCPAFPYKCEVMKPSEFFSEWMKFKHTWKSVCQNILEVVDANTVR